MENKPIRVLQMIASLYSGGSQAMIMNLYRNIDRSKIQFDFIVEHPEYDYYKKEIEELGGKIYTMPAFKGTNIKEIKSAWNKFFEEHKEYKILHSHSRSHASLYLPIAKKHGLKTIIHSHNTSNGKGMSSFLKNVFQYPLRFQADYFIGCSKESGKWLFGNKIIKSDRFFVLNNAIDANRFRYNKIVRDSYRKQFGITNQKVYIQVGSLSNQKNHEFTLKLFKSYKIINSDFKLFVVGVGENELAIKEKIKEYDLDNNVFMLGRRDDVNKLLQMADYFIMPSIYEGLSVAAVEAQASGIKCLLSDEVSNEVKITNQCEFLPLEIDKWIKCLSIEYDRLDTYREIMDAKYDISYTSELLQSFYKRII